MSKLEDLFSDNTGGLSVMRIVVASWTALVIGLLIHANWGSATFVDIPGNLYLLTAAAWACKMGQRAFEKDPETPVASTTTTTTTVAPVTSPVTS